MKLTRLKATYDAVQAENRLHRHSNVLLAIAVLAAVFGLLGRDTVVVLQPPTLSEESEVGPNWASESYKRSWGLYLATLMGNVKPGSADFVKTALDPLLASSIYQQTMELVETQVQQIQRDRVSLSFEPENVSYEIEADKVFVTGQSVLTGPTGKGSRETRTYEYEFKIVNYKPVLVYLHTYGGEPLTTELIEKEQAREQRRLQRERAETGN